MSNLVGNAVKFTSTAGSTSSPRQLPDGGAQIEVVDTGGGIQEAELPLIFDRFYRGSGDNEARGTGSGLGLAIVKSIVDMHHGTIEVESRVGGRVAVRGAPAARPARRARSRDAEVSRPER